jgi:Amt family ammonium transporter
MNGLDTLWILLCAFLVFFMQAGFGMVETGLVRTKNAGNVLMKNVIDFSFAALGYFVFGYAIMYGSDGPLIGTSGWFMVGAESPVEGVPVEAFWLFQAVFAGAAATIVAGAVAERMKFVAYLFYSFIITAFIYPIVGHWVWGGGWLAQLGFHDFAGSTVVHALGGVCALVGAIILKPRYGKFNKDGSPNVISGHNMPLVAMGVFILWFGWYGFNAGSTLGFGDPQLVSRIALNTTLSPAVAAFAAMALSWIKYGKPDLSLSLNGLLGGLVGITAPCAVVGSGSAIMIGLISGMLVVFAMEWMNKLKIDDVVGAFPVHGVCGIFGTLAVGIFGTVALGSPQDGLLFGGGFAVGIFGTVALGSPQDGLLFGGGFGQLGIQSLGIVACLGFTAISMWIVFKVIDSVIGLRVSKKTELKGLDIEEHGMESYSGFQIFTTE